MKRIFALSLVLMMAVGMAACKCSVTPDDTPQNNTAVPTENGAAQTDDNSGEGGNQNAGDPESAKLTGELVFIDLDDRDASVLRRISLAGNRAGSDEFNAKEPSASGIRCIFELNEYVSAIPDTDLDRIEAYVLKHRDDQSSYETADFSDSMDGFAYLFVIEKSDDPEYWGSFYLNPDECEPGYYDLVFVHEGKAIATMLTRFYNEGELDNKTDAELEAIMKG